MMLERRALTLGGAAWMTLPFAVWTGQLVALAIGPGLGWTPELVIGVVPLTAAVGGVLGALAAPGSVGRRDSRVAPKPTVGRSEVS
jgi:hypothetical protein